MQTRARWGNFYPRSPCGERRGFRVRQGLYLRISIHALLAESDTRKVHDWINGAISIHALLAESDLTQDLPIWRRPYFYPRSPCGERQNHNIRIIVSKAFLSTLSLRRATLAAITSIFARRVFLSTLSLRRATVLGFNLAIFLPISIHALLAESDGLYQYDNTIFDISIHALLAESDAFNGPLILRLKISIHALLAESDVNGGVRLNCFGNFYPRSPCGERRVFNLFANPGSTISIHALLAESDALSIQRGQWENHFYPRSPCGERRGCPCTMFRRPDFYPRSPCGERRQGLW